MPDASDQFVTLDRRSDGVAVVRLDRPKANALSLSLLTQLMGVAQELIDEPPGAVVLWGGERIFAAGADISEFGGPEEARAINQVFRQALDALAAIPRAVIAAVTGYALGGGCELACACDLRVVSQTARLGQPEVLLGVIPGAGGTQRLARLIGPARAKDLVLTGRMVDAEEALRIGLADRVVPGEQVFVAAVELAAGLAAGAVVAQGLAKQAIDSGFDGPLATGLDREAELFVRVFGTEDAKTGVQSFLAMGPGKAIFRGR
jgi:enoyl-CoA hydratase/carnithine racemase